MGTYITKLKKLDTSVTTKQILDTSDKYLLNELRITNTNSSNDRTIIVYIGVFQNPSYRASGRSTPIKATELADERYYQLTSRVTIPVGTSLNVIEQPLYINENYVIFVEAANPEDFDIIINGYRD